jgi:hypothetical protein
MRYKSMNNQIITLYDKHSNLSMTVLFREIVEVIWIFYYLQWYLNIISMQITKFKKVTCLYYSKQVTFYILFYFEMSHYLF